jgi:hypothetical protein
MTNSSGEVSFENMTGDYVLFTVEHNDYFDQIDSFSVFNDTMIVIYMTNKLARVNFYISDASRTLGKCSCDTG